MVDTDDLHEISRNLLLFLTVLFPLSSLSHLRRLVRMAGLSRWEHGRVIGTYCKCISDLNV